MWLKINIQKTKVMASSPITSWQIDGKTMETVRDFIFLGSQIITDCDCRHEIKVCLFLRRKTMVNIVSSVTQLDLTLCHPMDCSTPSFPVHHNSWSLLKLSLSSWWCHPTISSSVVPFSSHLQSFPASGFFPMSQLFASGGQSIGVSASASVLPMNIQDWFPLGLTGGIS